MAGIEGQPTQRLDDDSPRPHHDDAIPQYLTNWDRYVLQGRLGSGGMGEVFKAWDPRLGRSVALKFLASTDPDVLERFQREARAQARVDHPAICKVFEVGDVGGRHYIAMQEIQGLTLDQAARPLTREQKIQLVLEVAEAVHAAHRLGLIHRDLKPSNILVEKGEDGSLRPFIVDFGLARDQESPGAATISGMIAGTVGYMSPEQARGHFEEIDRRSDVYNLGTILYELVTGRPPFLFDGVVDALTRLQTEEAPSPRRVDRSIPVDLDTIITKAMERHPSRRYNSAHAFAEDLRRFLDGEPVVARRAGYIYRLRTRLRKHRRVAAVVAVAAVLLMFAGGYALWERWRADARAELAQRFGMEIKEIELLTRVARMLPPDHTVSIQSVVVPRMERIRRQIAASGKNARGPGSYALARGSVALGDFPRAWTLLEETGRAGYETPDVHYARGQVLGHFYEEALTRAAAIPENEIRKAARSDAERQYRGRAIDELRRATDASIDAPELLRGQLALYERRYDEAIVAARRAGASAPWLYEAPLLEVRALRMRAGDESEEGKFEAALADYQRAVERMTSVSAVARADASVRYEDCRLRYDILRTVRFQRRLAMEEVSAADGPCHEALRLDPSMSGPWATIGATHIIAAEDQVRSGGEPTAQIAMAREALQRALALNAQDLVAWSALGRAELTEARWGSSRGIDPRPRLDVAQKALDRAVKGDPRNTGYRLAMANTLLTRGEYENRIGGDSRPYLLLAIEQAKRALESNSQIFLVHNMLGNTYNNLADRESARGGDPRAAIAEAAKAFEKASALNPSSHSIHNNQGNTWLTLAEYLTGRGEPVDDAVSKAIASYRRAIELRADYALPWFNIGYTSRLLALDRVRHGLDPTAALADSRAALDRFDIAIPGDVDSRVERARCAIIEARWMLARRIDPRPALTAADTAAATALSIDKASLPAMLVRAERSRWEAEWLSHNKQRTTAAIRAGLDNLALMKAADPKNIDAMALEGALLYIDARDHYPESAAATRQRAKDLVDKALQTKASLRPDYGSLQ